MNKTFFSIICTAFVFATLNSCTVGTTNPPPAPLSFLMVVHASPDAPNLDVIANSQTIASNFAYGASTEYLSAAPATYQIRMAPTTTTTYLIDTTLAMIDGKAYTLFAIDSLSKIKTVKVEDNFTTPPSDSSRIRLFHFSPDAPSVDIAVTGGDLLYSHRFFNDQNTNPVLAQFITLAAGTYNLEVRLAGTSIVLLALPNIPLGGGKVYTFYAKGFAGGSGAQSLSLGTIINSQ